VVSNNYINPAFCGWAAEVAEYAPAPGVDDKWRDATKALGYVTGDNYDVVSLGELSQEQIDAGVAPGMISLKTSVPVCDKTGPDFALFENAFGYYIGALFAELGYVEVSSDTNLVVDAPDSVGKGQELIISGTLMDIGGVPAAGQTIEFEVWEPTWGGSKPNSINCNLFSLFSYI